MLYRWLVIDAFPQTIATRPSLTRWVFVVWRWGPHAGYTVPNPVPVATWWLHKTEMKKTCYIFSSRLSIFHMGWLMGLEPTTTGITILDSTN